MALNNPLLDDRLFAEYNKLYNEVITIRKEYDVKLEDIKKIQINSILKNNYLNHIVVIILEKINQLSSITIENKKDISMIKDEIQNINLEMHGLKDNLNANLNNLLTNNNYSVYPTNYITDKDFNIYKSDIHNMINNNLKYEIISEIIKTQTQEKELLTSIQNNNKPEAEIIKKQESLNILDIQKQNDNYGWKKVKPKKNKIKLKNK